MTELLILHDWKIERAYFKCVFEPMRLERNREFEIPNEVIKHHPTISSS